MVVLGFLIMIGAAIVVGTINGIADPLRASSRRSPRPSRPTSPCRASRLLLRGTQGGFIDTGITEAIETKVAGVPLAFIVAVALGDRARVRAAAHPLGAQPARGRLARGRRPPARRQDQPHLHRRLRRLLALHLPRRDHADGPARRRRPDPGRHLHAQLDHRGRARRRQPVRRPRLVRRRPARRRLVQQTINSTTFLKLDQSWQYWIVGILVLIAAGIYTQARNAGRRA